MINRLRLASGIGCAFLASSVVYAATSDSKDNPLGARCEGTDAKKLQKKEISKVDGGRKIQKHDVAPKVKLQESISKARELCEQVRVKHGLPGLTIAVTVNGKLVYDEGFGYADVENNVKMEPNVIMRIASISKSMTTAMLAKLMEEDKINIDLPVQTYLPNFPQKEVDGMPVVITTRHLLSHLSGIRHYKKKGEKEKEKNDESEMSLKEYLLKEKFDSIEKSMELFINDELHHIPGTKYLYSSHAWTVVAGIIEKLAETPFPKHAKSMFNYWGLKNTHLDEHEPLIYSRARYYSRNKHGKLINAPYVDNSYKWSGGGFLSNVHDLTQFANMLLYCYQRQDRDRRVSPTCELGLPKKPYLDNDTVKKLWTGDPRTLQKNNPDFLYGLGFVVGDIMRKCMYCKERDLVTIHHSGAAVGASSILALAFPKNFQVGCDTVDCRGCDNRSYQWSDDERKIQEIKAASDVKGIAVAMITNLTDVSLGNTAHEIANLFKWLI
ncbi:unnamed protein product [Allacma fusca]|uniref:Beta-lactamase-related domain-containing protein n=1 Tax=Allacma fusca TaxID=39272 RepID=A0A8J2LCM5_9HEXA|nr:unnamed protein product [Allacma fusca]